MPGGIVTAAAAAAPYLLGAASAGGTLATNQANAREAQRNRDFQERMSNTAHQRSVRDLEAAGLNPALAYGSVASSPGGSTATFSDPVSSGIASAQSARSTNQGLKLAAEAQRSTIDLQNRQRAKLEAETDAVAWQSRLTQQQLQTNALLQPHVVRQAWAQSVNQSLGLAGAQRLNDINTAIGDLTKYLPKITSSADRGVADVLRFIQSARLGEMFK